MPVLEELRKVKFQSATLTFDHDFRIDLGNREVQVKFLGRGNTAGDAVAYLPNEKIVVAGDLVVYPIPYIYDGYPIGVDSDAAESGAVGRGYDCSRARADHARQDLPLSDERFA